MKKAMLFIVSCLMILTLSSCSEEINIYTDNEAMTIASQDEEIKILQITDLHLEHGISYSDRKTFKLIKALNAVDNYDLIVITGDLTMSPLAPQLYKKLINFMESLKTPWTFVFGNHDNDFTKYEKLIYLLEDTEYLYFKVGPLITDGGYGNFKINFTYQNEVIYHAYFLDSKNERDEYTEEEGEYGYLSVGQVQWYEDLVSQDTKNSVVFMHIPLRQMMEPESYDGIFNEGKVCAQGKDTGFFDAMLENGKSKAAFFGHDHLNDFTTMVDGIMLAYGRISGYSAYGNLERGGRIINIKDNTYKTFLVLESEVLS